MKTNNVILHTALLLGSLTVSTTFAQQTNATNAPIQLADVAGPKGPKPHHGPGGPHAPQPSAITALTTISGTVNQLTANDDGVLNGFTLNTGSATQAVRFGAHLGQQVSAAVKAGSRVTVTGYQKTSPAGPDANLTGETTFQLVKLDAGKTQIVDAPPAKPQNPTTPTQQTVSGQVADYQIDRSGRVGGLLMADQTVVKVPAHLAGQLATLAPKGSTITVNGFVQPLGEGQVQLQKRNVLRASVLTVGGQSYLLR